MNPSLATALMSGWLLSFVGSLPPGLISLTVTRENIQKGLTTALWIALGASLVEMVQAFVSVEFSQLLSSNEGFVVYFKRLAAAVFFGLALYLFSAKPSENSSKNLPPYQNFLLGVVVSALNFLAYPYWVFYGTYLQSEGWLGMGITPALFLGMGVAIGTFCAMLVYIFLSKWMTERLPQVIGATNKFLALLFLLLGIWQLYQNFTG